MKSAERDGPTVTIPVTEYEELLEYREALKKAALSLVVAPVPLNSPIDRDPELADFISERLGKMPVTVIARACRERFGAQRAPGKSAIHRYWVRLRSANRKG